MERARARDIVTDEGYTIAPFLLRIAAGTVDFAFCFALMALIFIFVYPFGFMPTLGDAMGLSSAIAEQTSYRLESNLYTDETGMITYQQFEDYTGYQQMLQDYYLVYQKEGNEKNPSPKCYDIPIYNQKVLYLPELTEFIVNSPYFDFYRDELGNPDGTKLGVIRKDLLENDGSVGPELKQKLLYWFQQRYSDAANEFDAEPYMKAATGRVKALSIVCESIAVFPPLIIFYVVIPLFDKSRRRTIAKRILRLATIDVRNDPLPWYLLLLRAVPAILVALTALLIDDFVPSLAIVITAFLVSLGFATFGGYRRSLHDLLARSVVVRNEDTLFELPEAPHAD